MFNIDYQQKLQLLLAVSTHKKKKNPEWSLKLIIFSSDFSSRLNTKVKDLSLWGIVDTHRKPLDWQCVCVLYCNRCLNLNLWVFCAASLRNRFLWKAAAAPGAAIWTDVYTVCESERAQVRGEASVYIGSIQSKTGGGNKILCTCECTFEIIIYAQMTRQSGWLRWRPFASLRGFRANFPFRKTNERILLFHDSRNHWSVSVYKKRVFVTKDVWGRRQVPFWEPVRCC